MFSRYGAQKFTKEPDKIAKPVAENTKSSIENAKHLLAITKHFRDFAKVNEMIHKKCVIHQQKAFFRCNSTSNDSFSLYQKKKSFRMMK